MKLRAPGAVIVGTAMLEGWRLLFRKYATIRKRKGYSVPVLVWRITTRDEKNLDRYEGWPDFYAKRTLNVRASSLDGADLGVISAMAYIMTPEAINLRIKICIPDKHYYSVIKAGYESFGFDDKIFAMALAESVDRLKPR